VRAWAGGFFLPNFVSRDLISVIRNLPNRTEVKDSERPSDEFLRPVWKNVFVKKVFLFDRFRDLR